MSKSLVISIRNLPLALNFAQVFVHLFNLGADLVSVQVIDVEWFSALGKDLLLLFAIALASAFLSFGFVLLIKNII